MQKYLWDYPLQKWLNNLDVHQMKVFIKIEGLFEEKRTECLTIIKNINSENYAESYRALLLGESYLQVCLIWLLEGKELPFKKISNALILKEASQYTKELYPFNNTFPFESSSLFTSTIYPNSNDI